MPYIPLFSGIHVRCWFVLAHLIALVQSETVWRDLFYSIVCVRNPLLQFRHALHEYATTTMRLRVIIVLNKSDLVPAAALSAWKEYFRNLCPHSAVCSVRSLKGGRLETRRTLLKAILDVRLTSESAAPLVGKFLNLNIDEVLEFRENVNTFQEGKCRVGDKCKCLSGVQFNGRT